MIVGQRKDRIEIWTIVAGAMCKLLSLIEDLCTEEVCLAFQDRSNVWPKSLVVVHVRWINAMPWQHLVRKLMPLDKPVAGNIPGSRNVVRASSQVRNATDLLHRLEESSHG